MRKTIKSKISIICVICLITFMAFGTLPAQAADDSEDLPVVSQVPIYMNGIKLSDGFLINETTYIPIRTFIDSIGITANIAWDEETQTATVVGEDLELTATLDSQYIVVNDRYFYVADKIQMIDGSIIVPIRVISGAFNVTVEWVDIANSVNLDIANFEIPEDSDTYYDQEDLEWLSHLVYAEAGNQPLEGKIGVGNVVLNRVEDPTCPDTVYGVVFDNKYGVQFSVSQSSIIYAEPNSESVIAAKMCLEGCNIVEDSIYFVNPDIGVSSWFSNTRVFVATIGEHDFYA